MPTLLLGVLLIAGCAAADKVESRGDKAPEKLLLFQKTPCFGTCPAYNATLYTDGSIAYVGLRYVPIKDSLQLQLPEKEFLELRKALQELNYPSLQKTYLSSYTDLPSTYLTFYENGKEQKRVKHQQDGPKALQDFITTLHEQIMQLVQEKAQSQQ
ncbi:DUF6438 domain-containing protein [Pontibacter mangrovi]|uniref:DUF6438 domain-containing protein n=1 Tax=Pontibacter mangrovi TaxID=2589816 RepID=UPI0015E2994C|nr:DUF6438 domain-containing protein [Pontibacter mangrovi]